MSRTLSKLLGTDLAALAQVLRSKGWGRDTVLAHITPKEAALLKRRGGRGSINPDTGLPEFEDDYSPIIDSSADTGGASEFGGAPAAPVQPVDQGGGGGAPQVDQFTQGGDVGPNGGPPADPNEGAQPQ